MSSLKNLIYNFQFLFLFIYLGKCAYMENMEKIPSGRCEPHFSVALPLWDLYVFPRWPLRDNLWTHNVGENDVIKPRKLARNVRKSCGSGPKFAQ